MTRRFCAGIWITAISLSLGDAVQAQQTQKPTAATSAPAAAPAPKPPWGRIVMIGASASAGFTETEPIGGPTTPQYRLSRYLDAAIIVPHEPMENLASAMMFLQPETVGRQQIALALKAEPTLVVGADFLFWFCYGEGQTDAERLQRFENGLKMVDVFKCPVVLGDIPDASAAVNRMLSPGQIPSAEAMAAANKRLKEWAASRPQVVLVPLKAFMHAAMANHAITLHGRVLPEGKTRALLQSDNLHPSPAGTATLALAILDAFESRRPPHPDREIRWDPREVFRLGLPKPPAESANKGDSAVPGRK